MPDSTLTPNEWVILKVLSEYGETKTLYDLNLLVSQDTSLTWAHPADSNYEWLSRCGYISLTDDPYHENTATLLDAGRARLLRDKLEGGHHG